MDSSANLLNRANNPAHIEAIGHLARDGDAVPLEPIRRMRVQYLKAGGVADEPLADPAESPDDQGSKEGDRERQELRDSGLKEALKGPHDGDDEEGENDRRQNRAGGIECGKDQDC